MERERRADPYAVKPQLSEISHAPTRPRTLARRRSGRAGDDGLRATDASFPETALQGDHSEMALGGMDKMNEVLPGCCDIGKTLRKDHAGAKQKALPVVQAHADSDTNDMVAKLGAAQHRLRSLHARRVDQAFARDMGEDSRKDDAVFEKQVGTDDRATRMLAQATLPALKQHRKTAQALAPGSR